MQKNGLSTIWNSLNAIWQALFIATSAILLSLILHWILWKLWVQRYQVEPGTDLAIELAFAASLVGFVTIGLGTGFGWFAIHEYQQSRKQDLLELRISDEGTGTSLRMMLEGDEDFFEINVFIKNKGNSIVNVFGFIVELPLLNAARMFNQTQPDWGHDSPEAGFGTKVITTSSTAALDKNIQLRRRGTEHSLQFTNSHDIAVFPSQTLLLFSLTVPAEACVAQNGKVETYICPYTLYSLNGVPELGTFEITLICGENKAQAIAENRELRNYPNLRPYLSKPYIEPSGQAPGELEANEEACVFSFSIENAGPIPAKHYSVCISAPFLEYVWDSFRDRYGLTDGHADRTKMFSMMKHPMGEMKRSWQFFDDSDLDASTTLEFCFTSQDDVTIPAHSKKPITRFEIPTSVISGTKSFTCQYEVAFDDGKTRKGELDIYLTNNPRNARGPLEDAG